VGPDDGNRLGDGVGTEDGDFEGAILAFGFEDGRFECVGPEDGAIITLGFEDGRYDEKEGAKDGSLLRLGA